MFNTTSSEGLVEKIIRYINTNSILRINGGNRRRCNVWAIENDVTMSGFGRL